MKNKRVIKRQTRGWLPKDPVLLTSNNASYNRKIEKWIANPFPTLGPIMIISSLLSAAFGIVLVSSYLWVQFEAAVFVSYSGFYVGILSLAAFVLGLYSGMLLLLGKHFTRAVTGMLAIFCFGITTVLIPIIEGLPSTGVLIAFPMLASSVTSLLIMALYRVSQKTTRIIPKKKLTTHEKAFIGLGTTGCGFTIMSVVLLFSAFFIYRAQAALLIIGVTLLVAAFLVRRTYKH